MNLLYCGDKNIEPGLWLSIMSILHHTKEELSVYVMTMELVTEERSYERVTEACIQKLGTYLKKYNEKNSIVKIDVTDIFLNNAPIINIKTRFTPYCMLRLFADQVDVLPDKILYLDNDVICRQDIKDFYEQDTDDVEFVGVLDYYGSWFFRKKFYKRDYINSGVLLLNMKKIRKSRLFERARNMCALKKMFMPDQSALNKLAEKKRIAPRRYNEQRRLYEDTVLQHFTTSFRLFPILHHVTVKPWQFEKVHKVLKLHEYDELFDEYTNLF